MKDDPQNSPKIIGQMPPKERIFQLNDWHDKFDSLFLKESTESFRKGMKIVLDYLETHHPISFGVLDHDLYIYEEPPFNALLDTKQRFYSGDPAREDRLTLGEIRVNIGIPMTLACIEPVLFFASQSAVECKNEPAPTEIVAIIGNLFMAWHDDTFPTPSVKSLKSNPAFDATLLFIIAHEVSHFVFQRENSTFMKYKKTSSSLLEQLLLSPDFFTIPQINYIKKTFQNQELHASWVEELAADMMAYDICSQAVEKKVWHDMFGLTTLCSLQVIFEHYLELEKIQITQTHPFAMVRLIALEKYKQNQSGLTTPDFFKELGWLLPTQFFYAIFRILQQIKGITWADSIKDSNTIIARVQNIRFKGVEYLLFESGEIATRETVEKFEFPYAHLFENGDIMQFGKRIGTISEIQLLSEGEIQIDINKKIVKFL